MYFKVFFLTILACLSSGSQLRASSVKNEPEDFIYGVIADCGSSGTRAHIFKWGAELNYPELLNHIEPLRDENGAPITMKVYPGLSTMGEDPAKSVDYVKPILNFITANIPPEKIDQTGIYFLGTAGMRLLNEEVQLEIYKNIRDYIEKNYNFAKVRTSVISGADEGMYQWITINSKTKQFHRSQDTVDSRTYSVIEMGGASVQVTYQLEPDVHRDTKHYHLNSVIDLKTLFDSQIVEPQISRNVDRYKYKLVSTTFLGLGSNSAREAYVDLLVNMNYDSFEDMAIVKSGREINYLEARQMSIPDPCLPIDAFDSVKKPIRMLGSVRPIVGFHVRDDDETFNVKLIGRGNYTQCKRLVKKLLKMIRFDRINCLWGVPCTIDLLGKRFIPFDRFHYVGLGELYYTTHEMLNMAGTYSKRKITKKTEEICETPYKLLLEIYRDANKADKTRILLECFKALWVDTLLVEGLQMPKGYNRLETIRQVKGDDLDWSLGAMLDKSLTIEEASDPDDDEKSQL